MELSTNLPSGTMGIKKHLDGGAQLATNVNKEADAAFMSGLERTEPKRYARLIRNMQVAAVRAATEATVETKKCQHCGLVLPSDIRRDALYCDSTCQRDARRVRKAA